MTPLELLLKVCPNAQLNFFQMEMIESEITDVEVWKETLKFWFGNGYRAQSVFKMIQYYNEKVEERSRGRWQDVGRDDHSLPTYKCSECLDGGKVRRPDPNGQYSFSMVEVDCECSVSH